MLTAINSVHRPGNWRFAFWLWLAYNMDVISSIAYVTSSHEAGCPSGTGQAQNMYKRFFGSYRRNAGF